MEKATIQEWTDSSVPLDFDQQRRVRYRVYRESERHFLEVREPADDSHIHTLELPEGLKRAPKSAKIIRVDAQKIAFEERSRENAVLIGTLAEAVPELDRQAILQALEATFADKAAAVVEANGRAFNRGADEAEVLENVG